MCGWFHLCTCSSHCYKDIRWTSSAMAAVSREKTLRCIFGKESYNTCRTKPTPKIIFQMVLLGILGIVLIFLCSLFLSFWLKKHMPSWRFLSSRREKQEPPPPSKTCTTQNLGNCTEPPMNTLTDHNGVPLEPPTPAYSSHVPSYRSASPVPAYIKESA